MAKQTKTSYINGYAYKVSKEVKGNKTKISIKAVNSWRK